MSEKVIVLIKWKTVVQRIKGEGEVLERLEVSQMFEMIRRSYTTGDTENSVQSRNTTPYVRSPSRRISSSVYL